MPALMNPHSMHWEGALETFVLIVKVLGVIVTALVGLLGLTSRTLSAEAEAKIERGELVTLLERLNVHGRFLLRLTVSCVLVTLAAQGAEIYLKLQDDKKKEHQAIELLSNTTNQLRLAGEALNRSSEQLGMLTNVLSGTTEQLVKSKIALEGIERLVTRFDRVTIRDLVYQLPLTNRAVLALAVHLDQIVARVDSNHPNARLVGVSPMFAVTNGPAYVFDLHSPELAFKTNSLDQELSLFIQALEHPDFEVILLHKRFDAQMRAKLQSGEDTPDPQVDFGATGEPPVVPPSETSSETAPTSWGNMIVKVPTTLRPTLTYYPNTKEIFIHWRDITLPKENWHVNGTITSVRDLDHVYCLFNLSASSGGFLTMNVFQDMCPRQVEVSFDTYSVTLDKFDLFLKKDLGSTFETDFPSREEILNGSAHRDVNFL